METSKKNHSSTFLLGAWCHISIMIIILVVLNSAYGEIFGGIDFPSGVSSFADNVIQYDPLYSGGPAPTRATYINPDNSLGPPNYVASNGSVSLGRGGLIELEFTDNLLTNSGDTALDLHIFEVGPDIEDTFVEIRPTPGTFALLGVTYDSDGDGFYEVGKVMGHTSSIDIDAFLPAYPPGTLLFDAVQLIDDPDEGSATGATVGADIDSVGAIQSLLSCAIYVDDSATGANNGTSWTDAYMYLQDALAEAATCQQATIKVAQGVYIPDRATINPEGTGDRNATFQLISGVIVEGGYAGVAGDDPDARDVIAYETVLSGDLLGDDIDEGGTYSDNSYHVVTADQTDVTTVLDGFTIMAGNADANDPDHAGGGLLVIGGNPVISNCIFLDNQAGWSGGGAFCQDSGVTFRGCTFVRNTAAHGGGLYHLSAQDAIVEDSIFAMNECTYEGGALALDGGNAQINACVFQGNVASWSGGAIFVHPAGEKSHKITLCEFIANTALGQGDNKGGGAVMDRGNETALSHCIFQGNRSFGNPEEQSGLGGAVYCDGASTTLINCTFAGNFANAGRALACDVYEAAGYAIVSNCIMWDDGEEIWIGPDCIVSVSYSDIQFADGEIYSGLDNINADPNFALPGYWSDPNDPNLLADPQNPDAVWMPGDYHLMSVEGRWDPVLESWVQDESTSPCIDVGDPNSPWDEEPEPNGGRINLGAYGGTQEASMTPDTYTLTYRAGPNGSIDGETTQKVKYGEDGTEVIAEPNEGYHFTGWSDSFDKANRTDTNVTADVDVTANFEINKYTLTYRAGPNGRINGDKSQEVNYGEDGTEVIAEPNDGYRFKDWSDGFDKANRTDTNVKADVDVTANFVLNISTLTTTSTSGGSVTKPGEDTFTYEYGTDVDVEATADEYYYFLKWTGSAVDAGKVADPRSPNTTVHMDGDYDLKANFAAVNFKLTVSSTSGGSVTRPGEGEIVIDGDSLIQLKAEADQNYKFVKWTGSAVDAGVVDDPYSPNTRIYIDGNYNLVAHFVIDSYTLTISSTSGGSVTTPGEGAMEYDPGTQVSVVATPDEHYHFIGWTGSAVDAGKVTDPGSASTTVTVEGDYTLIANFEIDTHTLTISSNYGGSVTTPGEGVFEYDYGTVVDLAATADSNYRFKFWIGPAADTTSANTTITITEDITVSAVFVKTYSPTK